MNNDLYQTIEELKNTKVGNPTERFTFKIIEE